MSAQFKTRESDLTAAWRDQAVCAELSKDEPAVANAWVEESISGRFTAVKACRTCPVKTECLFSAIVDPQSYGWRAGFFFDRGTLSSEDNRRLQKQYGIRARPRQRSRTDTES